MKTSASLAFLLTCTALTACKDPPANEPMLPTKAPAPEAAPAPAPTPAPVPADVSPVAAPAAATPVNLEQVGIRRVKLTGKTLTATWAFVPPKVGELFTIDVMIADATGKPPENATVTVDATMPAHGHGMMTEPVVTPRGPGLWHAEGLRLHMHGAWELSVTVTTAAGKEKLTAPWDQPPATVETP